MKGRYMDVSVAELQVGINRYLELIDDEEIIITREGRAVAQLAPPPKDKLAILESLCGILPPTATLEEARAERLAKYEAGL